MQKFKMVNHSKIIELLDMKYWGFWLTMFYIMVLPTGILAEVGVEPRKIVLGTHQPLSGPMKNYAQIGRVLRSISSILTTRGNSWKASVSPSTG